MGERGGRVQDHCRKAWSLSSTEDTHSHVHRELVPPRKQIRRIIWATKAASIARDVRDPAHHPVRQVPALVCELFEGDGDIAGPRYGAKTLRPWTEGAVDGEEPFFGSSCISGNNLSSVPFDAQRNHGRAIINKTQKSSANHTNGTQNTCEREGMHSGVNVERSLFEISTV